MAIDDFFVTPVTVRNPGSTTDRNGNTIDDWTTATSVSTSGWLQDLVSRRPRAGAGVEVQGGRDTLVSAHQLFLPADTAISGYSRVLIDGQTFEVDGAPTTTRTPEGAHHLEVQLHLIDDIHSGALA